MTTRWQVLDLARPLRHARELAGLTQDGAAVAMGLPPGDGRSAVTSPEQRNAAGASCLLSTLLDRCAAYGLRVKILVSLTDD